jgi:hypothetical protein
MHRVIDLSPPDFKRKKLYSQELKQKVKSKSIYFYIYLPIRKSYTAMRLYQKIFNKFKYAKLINLPSSYTFFKTYLIQGPRIHLFLVSSFFFEQIHNFKKAGTFIIITNLKWYAFFLLLELNSKYQLLFKLCFDLKFNSEIFVISTLSSQK